VLYFIKKLFACGGLFALMERRESGWGWAGMNLGISSSITYTLKNR
jgi:hypothetical protein